LQGTLEVAIGKSSGCAKTMRLQSKGNTVTMADLREDHASPKPYYMVPCRAGTGVGRVCHRSRPRIDIGLTPYSALVLRMYMYVGLLLVLWPNAASSHVSGL
jgi:hypothetical protein